MLAKLMAQYGISQNRLSKMSGVPQSVIQYILTGKTKHPRIDTLQALANVFGVTVDELMARKAS